jgi:hypothetical protein
MVSIPSAPYHVEAIEVLIVIADLRDLITVDMCKQADSNKMLSLEKTLVAPKNHRRPS